MTIALEQLHQPAQSIPAVQVVGTNGKGSIACLIHHGLMAAGLRSGLTTSPHLASWCERIRVNDQLISIRALRQTLQHLQPLTEQCRLTPFEQLICTALIHFEAQKADWLVLEAGLGGRLDATTAHSWRPLIAVASIGLDHREHLGPNLEAIAAEKAAAIGEGAHVISATQEPEVSAVLEQRVGEMKGSLQWVDALDESWALGLSGAWQKRNGAVAAAALQWMSRRSEAISNQAIRAGFATARWPGRLQWMRWRGLRLRVDGAHNPPAAIELARERCIWSSHGTRQVWILAIQAQKQAPEMLQQLLSPQDEAWIVPVPGHRSWSLEQLQQALPLQTHQLKSAQTASHALDQLLEQGWPESAPVIAGSLYLIGHLMENGSLEAE
ncbi:folylpolyglutamate synthase/dihydrofolate synthase family protein [Synechococcus sp. MIT S9509]|uniref:bifunctional folylpolyglutamate synthase/dihydrofolate synthase n=1 Tax=Synechococcus sp. MIT S9509 TaxID=1801630 RepID=UPI001E3C5F84|nr:dihydrofolate synthase [Synechococcus sp. MIT S9509]